jgi:hypothetical protein
MSAADKYKVTDEETKKESPVKSQLACKQTADEDRKLTSQQPDSTVKIKQTVYRRLKLTDSNNSSDGSL